MPALLCKRDLRLSVCPSACLSQGAAQPLRDLLLMKVLMIIAQPVLLRGLVMA